MQELSPEARSFRVGAVWGATFAAALGVAGLLASPAGVPPLAVAFAASLVLAGLQGSLNLYSPFERVEITRTNVTSWLASGAIAFACLTVLANAVPAVSVLSCQPLIPWRVSIAASGAFACSWMVKALAMRPANLRYQPLVVVALGWIAPFYGFFHPPWFLAQMLALPCSEHPLPQGLLAAAAMSIAAYGGARVADWMFGHQD